MNRNARHQFSKSPFTFEGLHKGGPLESGQHVHTNAAGQVNAASRQNLHRKVGCLASENRNEHINGRGAQLLGLAGIEGVLDNRD